MQSLEDLRDIVQVDPRLTVINLAPGYPAIRVETAGAAAEVALHGAHLTHWQPAGADPVIFTSPDAIYREGKAIRGGVPICWPWFNAHPTDPSKPSHGFARNRFWTLSETGEDDESVLLFFDLEPSEETKALWPHQFALSLTLRIGATLRLDLTTENLDDAPFTISSALHTYFAVGDLAEVSVHGLEDTDYLDTVGDPTVRQQDGPITFGGEVDRIYRAAPPVRLTDRAFKRSILLGNSGSNSTVVWNPSLEKAQALADLPDNAFRDFVCIETANAGEDLVTIQPGESHTLKATMMLM